VVSGGNTYDRALSHSATEMAGCRGAAGGPGAGRQPVVVRSRSQVSPASRASTRPFSKPFARTWPPIRDKKRDKKMDKPVLVGHSLGGFLALWLAEREPSLVGPLVLVDSLPFLAAVMNAAATAESMKAPAEQMRKMYSGPPNEESDKRTETAIKAMVTKPEDVETIVGWSHKSDRVAMGDALYEMMTTDLDKITSPTLVIGTWIGYKQYATREQVEKNFRAQYAKLGHYDFVLEDTARHFVMLDDPDGFFQAVDRFLGLAKR
jgi:N-formylmaleamate deformylase